MSANTAGENAFVARLIPGLALVWSLFQIYTSYVGPFNSLAQRGIHVGFALTLIFLMYRRGQGWGYRVLEWLVILVSLGAIVFVILNFDTIMSLRMPVNLGEKVLGTVFVLIILEACRRTIGLALPILAVIAVIYAAAGHLIPGFWGHPPIFWRSIIEVLYLSDSGAWGSITGIVATMVAMFMIFGSMLVAFGGTDVLMKLSGALARRTHGGAAQTATVASALFGTISGSAASNVATTGAFTMPMMRRAGYSPAFAGAVEAVASTGGQIMPPVMGAGAFIMTELVGVPYLTIIKAAAIPALLYYLCLWATIEFEAVRLRIRSFGQETVFEPVWRVLARWQESGPFVLALAVLVVVLLLGYTPEWAALYSVAVCTGLHVLPGLRQRSELRVRLRNVTQGLIEGGKAMAMVAAIVVCAQIIISMVTHTGIATKMAEVVLSFGQEYLILAALLSMVITTFLGMGLPTTAAYILGSAVLSATLIKLGVSPLSTHLFIFYYACLSQITPPVCPAVYIAAGMVKANWVQVARHAVRLGLAGFLVPFVFIFSPGILLEGPVTVIIWDTLTAIIGVVALASASAGWLVGPLRPWHRLVLGAGALGMVTPGVASDLVGLAVLAAMLIRVYFGRRGARSQAAAAVAE